jgi:hypothetical protein
MTGEDTHGEVATQCRCSVEACTGIAGGPHEDQARPPDEQMPGPPRGGQSAKRDEETNLTNPNIAMAEQWLCFLLGLICMVCGIVGICMKYSQGPSSAYIPWLGSAYGPTLRFTAIACFGLGAVLVRWGWARPDRSSISIGQKSVRSARGNRARGPNVFPALQTILSFGWKWRGRNQRERRP